MEVTYEKETDSKYVQFKKGKVEKTEEVKDWLFLDYDKEDNVLGAEILDASKHQVNFAAIGGVLIGFSLEEESVSTAEIKSKAFEEDLVQEPTADILQNTLVASY